MDNEGIQGKKFSEFPAHNPVNADEVVGLHSGGNARFSISNLIQHIRGVIDSIFVPQTRTINGSPLSSDIELDANDIGAQPTITANGILKGDGAGNVTAAAAADIPYDNTGSGLSASDVQDAIDELAAGAGGSTAASTSYDNAGSGLLATNVQDAIDELSDEKADQITVAPVETSTTASEAHGLGSVFYLGGKLYRALADIAAGGTINTAAGGNATETSIAQNFKRTVTLTSAQYAQLSAAEKAADILYIITDEPAPSAYTSNPEMDGTASPGSSGAWARGDHVHPSDTNKANQTQLAYVETGTTTSRAYAVGEYFCKGGLLYRATTPISSGGTITPGTNCEAVTEGGLNSFHCLSGELSMDITGVFMRFGSLVTVYLGTCQAAINGSAYTNMGNLPFACYQGINTNVYGNDREFVVDIAANSRALRIKWVGGAALPSGGKPSIRGIVQYITTE